MAVTTVVGNLIQERSHCDNKFWHWVQKAFSIQKLTLNTPRKYAERPISCKVLRLRVWQASQCPGIELHTLKHKCFNTNMKAIPGCVPHCSRWKNSRDHLRKKNKCVNVYVYALVLSTKHSSCITPCWLYCSYKLTAVNCRTSFVLIGDLLAEWYRSQNLYGASPSACRDLLVAQKKPSICSSSSNSHTLHIKKQLYVWV